MNISKYIHIGLIAIFLLQISSSCKKETIVGGDVNKLLSGKVEVTEGLKASKYDVDFSKNETVYFSAKFKDDTYWRLTITNNDQAVQIIEGSGKEINASNATWRGNANIFLPFDIGQAYVSLSFPWLDSVAAITNVYLDTINVLGSAHTTTEIIVADFNFTNTWNASVGCGNFPFVENGCSVTGWISEWPWNDVESTLGAPDGSNYVTMGGSPWQGTPWGGVYEYSYVVDEIIDGDTIIRKDSTEIYSTNFPLGPVIDKFDIAANNCWIYDGSTPSGYAEYFPVPTNDITRVFFNIFVYSYGDPYTKVSIEVSEDGGSWGDGAIGGTWIYDIIPDWVGWKLVSIPYEDLLKSQDNQPPMDPSKITGVSIKLQCDAPQELKDVPEAERPVVRVCLDHIAFSIDEPLAQ